MLFIGKDWNMSQPTWQMAAPWSVQIWIKKVLMPHLRKYWQNNQVKQTDETDCTEFYLMF